MRCDRLLRVGPYLDHQIGPGVVMLGRSTGAVLLGLAVERFTIRPLIGQPLFAAVLMTLALGEVLRGFALLNWGSQE